MARGAAADERGQGRRAGVAAGALRVPAVEAAVGKFCSGECEGPTEVRY